MHRNVNIHSISTIICHTRNSISIYPFNRWGTHPSSLTSHVIWWPLSTPYNRAWTGFRLVILLELLCRLRMSVENSGSPISLRAARRAKANLNLCHRPQTPNKEKNCRFMPPLFPQRMAVSGANLKKRLKRCKMKKSSKTLKITGLPKVFSAKNFRSKPHTGTIS